MLKWEQITVFLQFITSNYIRFMAFAEIVCGFPTLQRHTKKRENIIMNNVKEQALLHLHRPKSRLYTVISCFEFPEV